MASARDAFAEEGMSVTLDEIARRAGVGVGTVYRRFADKEQLVEALFEDQMKAFVELAERCLADADPWEGLMRFLDQACALHACDRGFKEVALSGSHGHERVERARQMMYPVVVRLVARAQDDGTLRPDLAATDVPLLQLMVGSLSGCMRDVEPDAWRRFLTIITDGLRASRDEPTALGCEGLTPEQTQRVMTAWKTGSGR